MKPLLFHLLLVMTFLRADHVVRPVAYEHNGTAFEGTLVYPQAAGTSGQKLPGILMVPNWMGAGPLAVEKARTIADMGFVVFVADVYGRQIRPANAGEAAQAAGQVRADRLLMRARAAAALAAFQAQAADLPVDTDALFAIGFCFGGTTVLELARSGTVAVKGVVSFHGNLSTPNPDDGKNIRVPVLVLHGADDPIVPDSEVAAFMAEMRAASVDWQLVSFGGAVHSFTDPHARAVGQAHYDAKTAARAYEIFRDFVREHAPHAKEN